MSTETDAPVLHGAKQSPTEKPVHAIRGSVLAASLEGLRAHAHDAAYWRVLEPRWHEPMMFCLANSWAPLELAAAHYTAHEALALSPVELIEVCDFVAERVVGSFSSSLLRHSKVLHGESCPWASLREVQRLCERLFQGGRVSLQACTQRDAAVEIADVPLLHLVGFKQTMLALTRHAVRALAGRAFVREVEATDACLRMQVRWS